MRDRFAIDPEAFEFHGEFNQEMKSERRPVSHSGHWFRRGNDIVVLLDDMDHPGDNELSEVSAGSIPSRKDLIDERIDYYAQEALYRMFKGDPGARADASGMFTAVKAGQLTGLYIENQFVPAKRAQRLGLGWWQLIPKGEDAILQLDPVALMAGPPLIAFRDSVKSDPSRLDPALRKAWATCQLLRAGQLKRCDLRPPNGIKSELSVCI